MFPVSSLILILQDIRCEDLGPVVPPWTVRQRCDMHGWNVYKTLNLYSSSFMEEGEGRGGEERMLVCYFYIRLVCQFLAYGGPTRGCSIHLH